MSQGLNEKHYKLVINLVAVGEKFRLADIHESVLFAINSSTPFSVLNYGEYCRRRVL